jgi:glycosyltransferase involved in cell wall biosynthesis
MTAGETKKSILHVVEDLKIGGLERVIESIVVGLDREKYHVEVWCLARGGDIAESLKRRGIPVIVLGLMSYYNPVHVLDLARRMKGEQFDLVHTHGYFASTFARLAAILAGVPVIIQHLHTTYRSYKRRNVRIEGLFSLFSDRVICVSRAVQEFAVETLGIHPNRTCVVYNTASTPIGGASVDMESLRRSLGIEEGDFVITTVASLRKNKGHEVLMDAIHQLAAEQPRIRCLIIGDGPLRRFLEEKASRLGLEKQILFLGIQPDVGPFLKMSHALALATIYREGLSVALIEGAAAGLPLLGSDIGGIPEVITDQANGFLIRPGDSAGLAAAVAKLMTNKQLRLTMGLRSREIYRSRFALEIMLRRIEEIYDRALARVNRAA